MAGDQIGDEVVEEFLRGAARRAFADAVDIDALVGAWVDRVRACPQSWEDTRAGLAAALVASGYRPEADVLREAADHFAAHWYVREQSVLIARELRNLADMGRATALNPAQPLPVADGSDLEPCGSDIGVFSPRRCVLPKGHGGSWHDDGSACWSTKEPS